MARAQGTRDHVDRGIVTPSPSVACIVKQTRRAKQDSTQRTRRKNKGEDVKIKDKRAHLPRSEKIGGLRLYIDGVFRRFAV
jgi:hypothetical protein